MRRRCPRVIVGATDRNSLPRSSRLEDRTGTGPVPARRNTRISGHAMSAAAGNTGPGLELRHMTHERLPGQPALCGPGRNTATARTCRTCQYTAVAGRRSRARDGSRAVRYGDRRPVPGRPEVASTSTEPASSKDPPGKHASHSAACARRPRRTSPGRGPCPARAAGGSAVMRPASAGAGEPGLHVSG
jgi:hypothetical protein